MIAAGLWRRSEGLGRFTSASPLLTCRGRAPRDAPASIITVYDFDAVCAGEDLSAFAAERDRIVVWGRNNGSYVSTVAVPPRDSKVQRAIPPLGAFTIGV